MARNEETETALAFHEGTKHPGGRLLNPHHVYTGERPLLFKKYEGGQHVPLPVHTSAGEMSALQAIAARVQARARVIPGLEMVARLLHFSAGITKRIDYGPRVGTIPFRAAACTGALYHIELYLVCADLPGLAAGVYHFDPQKPALTRLREGDLRGVLMEATGGAGSIVAQAPLTIVYSDVYWRNAIKYQAREYRHAFWDSGTILSHSLALAAAHDLPAQVVLGFADQAVNDLLGLDANEEFALALLPVGSLESGPPQAPAQWPALQATSSTKWPRKIAAILEMHRASSLDDGHQAARWQEAAPALHLPEAQWEIITLPKVNEAQMAQEALENVILRRGSSRHFERKTLSLQRFSIILQQATSGLAADFASSSGPSLNHLYVLANAVQDVAPGAYVYHPAQHLLERLRQAPAEQVRREAGHLALGQELGADAAANIYFLSELQPVLAHFGNRGYRAAQLEASIMAGRLYLAAYAQGVGATGLTFYDDAVVRFFSPQDRPHAEGKSVMFLVAVGGDRD